MTPDLSDGSIGGKKKERAKVMNGINRDLNIRNRAWSRTRGYEVLLYTAVQPPGARGGECWNGERQFLAAVAIRNWCRTREN